MHKYVLLFYKVIKSNCYTYFFQLTDPYFHFSATLKLANYSMLKVRFIHV